MFSNTFYHGLLKKYITYFGTLFNDIEIERVDANNTVVKHFKVPLSLSGKEKHLTRVEGDPNIDRPFATILPRMSFELTSCVYDAERKLGTANRIVVAANNAASKTVWEPVPYNLGFKLYIYANKREDGDRIVESILPYFTPDFTATVELIDEMNVTRDVPVTHTGTTFNDENYGEFVDRRILTWDMDFVMNAFFYGPVKTAGLIKLANVNFYIPTANDIQDQVGLLPAAERLTVQPGVDANGVATTNLAIAIPYQQVEETDDWSYIVTIDNTPETP